jgi:hypothetical protein
MTTVPRDIPHDMTPYFLEGVRHGAIRDESEGYLAEAEELERSSRMEDEIFQQKVSELRRRHVFYMRGFHEGRMKRSALKGGVK